MASLLRASGLVSAGLVWCVAIACSSEGATAEANGVRGNEGGSGANPPPTATGGTGTIAVGCDDADDCGAEEKCSVIEECIPKDQCRGEGDCLLGEVCGKSQRCHAPGGCAAEADCETGFTCDATGACVPGSSCGDERITVEAVPPNLLLVLDRSCSMTSDFKGNKVPLGPNKWTSAVGALDTLLSSHGPSMRWGLLMFPDAKGGECKQEEGAQIPIAPGTHGAIQKLLAESLVKAGTYFPDDPCTTPIDLAMAAAATLPELADTTRQNYTILITDGKQTDCSGAGGGGDKGTEKTISALLTAGVKTFVVGFGGGVDPAQLNAFADRGGVPRNDPTTRYYQANDAAQLDMVLAEIAGAVKTCDFDLTTVPTDPTRVFTFIDGASVARDATRATGWDYDATANRVTLYGRTCSDLKSGVSKDVQVVFACDDEPPPELPPLT